MGTRHTLLIPQLSTSTVGVLWCGTVRTTRCGSLSFTIQSSTVARSQLRRCFRKMHKVQYPANDARDACSAHVGSYYHDGMPRTVGSHYCILHLVKRVARTGGEAAACPVLCFASEVPTSRSLEKILDHLPISFVQ